MSISQFEDGKVRLWTPLAEVESAALDQLRNVARLPWAFHHVAVMPDVHFGKGCTVGSVIAMKGALAPAAVGVDIGCGMGAVRTNMTEADLGLIDLKWLREVIEGVIPVGFNSHEKPYTNIWGLAPEIKQLYSEFKDLDPAVQALSGRAEKQLGTLGGGNHFIEICLDEGEECSCISYFGEPKNTCPYCKGAGRSARRVWLMLHSGSRNIGKELAEVHIGRARKLAHNALLPDRDLAVFLAGTREMAAYRRDLFWAQRYALLNRKVMFELLKNCVQVAFGSGGGCCGSEGWKIGQEPDTVKFDEPILCHHNYVAEENHFGEDVLVTRKGAIRAGVGELGIIPGSMGTASFIVEGLGCEESFSSASHGAGRRMSRGRAKRTFTQADLEQQTAGIECRKDAGVIDEIPGAYKDIKTVMENQKDLVKIRHELHQVLCVKG